MDTKVSSRAVAWAQVEQAWNAGSSHCLQCPHRREHTNPQDAISVQFCRLLADGTGNDFLQCPGFGAHDPVNELEERARRGLCVALQPRPYRDLFHEPAPILIGSAHTRAMPAPGASALLLQEALLETRTARRPPVLLSLAALFWNRFC
jgi:hypothetical protein